ncbi:MAG: RNA polymerase sigma factor [Fimbriiglobus sp.]
MDDGDWIAAAVGRYERPLVAYARGLLGDRHRSQDAVQETFLELCRRPRAEVEPHLALWLFTVCRRRAIDTLRKDTRMTALTADPPARSAGPADALEHQDATAAVLARLAGLPVNQREAVRLKFQNQFSYREIAEVMGLSESHVGVLLHLALKSLRQSFAAPAVTPAPRSQS